MANGYYEKWLKPENLILLQGWRRDGLSLQEIADKIGIKRQTLYNWQSRYDPIRQALLKGTEISNYEVENALYKAAIGYDVTETDQTETEHPDGTRTVTKHARKRHIPPSIGAICFILKNRRGDVWKDKPVYIDTTALEKLDAILKATKDGAESKKEEELEYITEDDIQSEAE